MTKIQLFFDFNIVVIENILPKSCVFLSRSQKTGKLAKNYTFLKE
jgi:hypothetical protein